MKVSNDLLIILTKIIEFITYSMAIVFAIAILLIDIVWLKTDLSEYSVTEISQELALLAIIMLFTRLAYQYTEQRNAHLLIAGFFACLLIRELDAFFDDILHGFWLYPALLVAMVTLVTTLVRQPKQTISQLVQFSQNSQYAYMIIGLMVILIFSRLFGMGLIWKSLLNEGYSRVVKNIAEEGVELFGYTLCFISTIRYCRLFVHQTVTSEDSELLLNSDIK